MEELVIGQVIFIMETHHDLIDGMVLNLRGLSCYQEEVHAPSLRINFGLFLVRKVNLRTFEKSMIKKNFQRVRMFSYLTCKNVE